MDIEYILFFLFGLVIIGFGIYCKFHQENMSVNANPAWPIEGQKKFVVALYFSFGLMITIVTLLLILFQSSENIDLVVVPVIAFFTLLMLWLSWKFIFSQVEKWRVIMLVVISVLTVAGIALVVYYICGFEPTAEIEAVNEVKEATEVDEIPVNTWAPDLFLLAFVELVVFIRMIFCPEKTRVFKNLTEEQRAKADLASFQKANALLYFLLFAILMAFGITALYVKMNMLCMLIPVAVFLPIYYIMNRRMKAYLGED